MKTNVVNMINGAQLLSKWEDKDQEQTLVVGTLNPI